MHNFNIQSSYIHAYILMAHIQSWRWFFGCWKRQYFSSIANLMLLAPNQCQWSYLLPYLLTYVISIPHHHTTLDLNSNKINNQPTFQRSHPPIWRSNTIYLFLKFYLKLLMYYCMIWWMINYDLLNKYHSNCKKLYLCKKIAYCKNNTKMG